jgi:hypothetical protein
MIRQLVTWVILLACVMPQAIPVLAETTTTEVTGTVPLIIYDTQVSFITSHTAIISWKTNSSASSQVFYDIISHGDTGDYLYQSVLDNTPVVLHSVLLTGLSPSTTYHYRVESVCVVDSIEFLAVSPDYTFKTMPAYAPWVLTSWPVGISPQGATLGGWLMNLGSASSVTVYFGWDTVSHAGNPSAYPNWTVPQVKNWPGPFSTPVSGLTPGKVYYFRAKAVGDVTSYGQELSFMTPLYNYWPWWWYWYWPPHW